MELGLYVDAHLGIGPAARAAEEAGFTHLWLYDSPLLFGDVYMACLEAARATSRIAIGPGVTTPRSRPAFATAQALGTLAVAAPGRVVLGIGIGNSARRSLGMEPSTLAELHEAVGQIRDLLAGRSTVYREGERAQAIRLIHPEGRWVSLAAPVPVWISAFGPLGQRRAAADADGILVRWEGPEALAEVRARVAAAAREAGRDPGEVKIGVVYAVYPIESDGELETQLAREHLGPLVVSRLRYLTANHESADEVPERFRAGFLAYQAHRAALDAETRHLENYLGYLVFTPEHLEEFVTPESMRTVCHVGSPAEVAAELQRMAEAGVDHVSLQLSGDVRPFCRRLADAVLPLVVGGFPRG